MLNDHESRVLDAIRSGVTRPVKISKVTCLGIEQVRRALSSLRKSKRVLVIQGEYTAEVDNVEREG